MISLSKPRNTQELAHFISQLNTQPHQHVGYCGTVAEEIEHTLLHDFSDHPLEVSFVTAYENNSVVGAMGLDIDQESNSAEIWGPFIDHENWEKLAKEMWDKLLNELPIPIHTFYGFYNVQNENAKMFMNQLRALNRGEHSILTIANKEFTKQNPSIMEISQEYYEPFKALHQEMFPHAYYSAEEMISKQNDKHKLFIAVQNGEFLGYVFCEANPEFAEGDIHFVAVTENARNRGIGRGLIEKSLQFLFSFEEMKEITLSVNSTNKAAINLYEKAGFLTQNRLNAYEITSEQGDEA